VKTAIKHKINMEAGHHPPASSDLDERVDKREEESKKAIRHDLETFKVKDALHSDFVQL